MRGARRWGIAILLAGCCASLAAWPPRTVRAQNQSGIAEENPDSIFAEKPHQPISYLTSYDRNVSRGQWLQSLTYNQTTKRVSFGVQAGITSVQGLRGLESNGIDGDISSHLDWRASGRWIWSLDGRFGGVSKSDNLASTDLRKNRVQIRTQYTANPWKRLTAVGIVSAEIEQDQSIGNRGIPRDTLRVPVDTTAVPPVYDIYASHAARDSSYSSGLRNGLDASATWNPVDWLEARVAAIVTRVTTTTNTIRREFWAPNPGEGATLQLTTEEKSSVPNGEDQYETRFRSTLIPKGSLELILKDHESDQQYYALARRALEHLSLTNRSGTLHLEQSPFAGALFAVDGTLGHILQEYSLQTNLSSESNTQYLSGNFNVFRPGNRVGLGFRFGTTTNSKQLNQNGRVVDRSLNASGMHRLTGRLSADLTSSISLFSRIFENGISDQDNVRGYVNTGAGYRVSASCSTTVHFSVNRAHAVAINENASGGNNVQTTYQMDAALRLRVTPTLFVFQNYQVNANYLIYDYDEPRNSLARIRRIDTVLQDSLFSFASVKLTHNFFFQDRGSYSRPSQDENRFYAVSQQLYAQNLGITASFQPSPGIAFYATQSVANSRNYLFHPEITTTRNRWNLNLGANVDRDLSGNMSLHGSIQHIGEYTERPEGLPSGDLVDYWVAGLTFMKDF